MIRFTEAELDRQEQVTAWMSNHNLDWKAADNLYDAAPTNELSDETVRLVLDGREWSIWEDCPVRDISRLAAWKEQNHLLSKLRDQELVHAALIIQRLNGHFQ